MHTCMSRQQWNLVYTLGEEVPKLVYAFLMCKPVTLSIRNFPCKNAYKIQFAISSWYFLRIVISQSLQDESEHHRRTFSILARHVQQDGQISHMGSLQGCRAWRTPCSHLGPMKGGLSVGCWLQIFRLGNESVECRADNSECQGRPKFILVWMSMSDGKTQLDFGNEPTLWIAHVTYLHKTHYGSSIHVYDQSKHILAAILYLPSYELLSSLNFGLVTDAQTDGRKATHRSSPCKCTGGLKSGPVWVSEESKITFGYWTLHRA